MSRLDERRPSLAPDPAPDLVEGNSLTPWAYAARLADDVPFEDRSALGSTLVARREVSPIVGTAPHWSHRIDDDLQPKLVIDDEHRRYDEDPHTERFLGAMPHVVVPDRSRYEFDVNRPPDVAIYARPKLAWGKQVWSDDLDQHDREAILERWYEFHSFVDRAVLDAVDRYGYAVLFDIHSYNYQRDAAGDWRDDQDPEINLGTAHLRLDDRGEEILSWAKERLQGFTVDGEDLRFGENEVFYGGYINRRVSRFFGPRCITLSVEFKKIFMDERTGELHEDVMADLVDQFDALVRDLGKELGVPTHDPPALPGFLGPGNG